MYTDKDEKPSPRLYAIGTAVPQHRIGQTEHAAWVLETAGEDRRKRMMLRSIYAGSGIDFRHSVLPEFGTPASDDHTIFHASPDQPKTPLSVRMALFEEHALPLLTEAASVCLDRLPQLQRSEISHVITFSCTGLYAPGPDVQLVEVLGLPVSAERTCINFMGCYAAINALKTAAHICRSEPGAVVLIAGVELCSLHYIPGSDTDGLVANAIFGDGAAAAIVSARQLQLAEGFAAFSLDQFYAAFERAGASDMVWRIGDFGFELRLSQAIPQMLEASIAALVTELLDRKQLTMEDIDHMAIHPGGVRILEACEAALGLQQEDNAVSYEILKTFGNMSSVTVLFVLERYSRILRKAGEKILACAFGPGLTIESMLLSVTEV